MNDIDGLPAEKIELPIVAGTDKNTGKAIIVKMGLDKVKVSKKNFRPWQLDDGIPSENRSVLFDNMSPGDRGNIIVALSVKELEKKLTDAGIIKMHR